MATALLLNASSPHARHKPSAARRRLEQRKERSQTPDSTPLRRKRGAHHAPRGRRGRGQGKERSTRTSKESRAWPRGTPEEDENRKEKRTQPNSALSRLHLRGGGAIFLFKESALLFKRILRGQRSEAHARIIPRPPVALGVIPRVPRLRVLLWGTAFCFNYFFL